MLHKLFLRGDQILKALKWSRDKAEYDAIKAMLHEYVVGSVKKPQVRLRLNGIIQSLVSTVDLLIRYFLDLMLVVSLSGLEIHGQHVVPT